LGATSDNPRSKATKLYSPHLPYVHYDEQWIRLYRASGFCGHRSNVHVVRERYIDRAYELATSQGVRCEHSGIAGLALMLQLGRRVPRSAKILIVSTGKVRLPE
jgi:hypothetical protein